MEIANVMEAVNAFGLTKRELDVLEGVLRAESNNRIASRLSIAPSTVKHHLASIFTKVGVMSRLQLAVFAMRHRLPAGPAAERRAAA